MLIPPSIAYILYSTITGDSIAVLFMSGMQAGLIFGLAFVVYSFLYAKRHNIPRQEKANIKEAMIAIKESAWALGLPVLILGGIYGGYFTPTEAAAVAAMYAIVVEMLKYKSINIHKFYELSIKSAKTIAMLMMLIAAGSVLSWVMTVAQIPQSFAAMLTGTSKIVVLLLINIIFLIAGMLIDVNSAIIVLTPLVYPAAMAAGIDSVHLATLIVTNLAIGMLTPPFGLNIFVATSALNVSYEKTVSGLIGFIGVSMLILLVITYLPEVSLFFPKIFLGY